jgi:sigma-B regulation protein RsbU (phosphoserine phosphatase)
LTTMLQGALSGMTLGTDPARVFNHVNKFLCSHSEVGRYATMFFGILDQDGQLEYINAGHPSPFLVRHGIAEEPFTEGSFPVGLVPEAEYITAHVKLEPGDTLILFSDGVTEAMDPGEELYGVPRLREVLTGQSECALEKLQKSILESVENFAKGAHQADDLTLLIVRYRSTPAVALTETDLSSSSKHEAVPAESSDVSAGPLASKPEPRTIAPEVTPMQSAAAAGGGRESMSASETLGPAAK